MDLAVNQWLGEFDSHGGSHILLMQMFEVL